MQRYFLALTFFFFAFKAISQEDHFGKVTYRELNTSSYALDTAASAIVLEEYGNARMDNGGDNNLLIDYYVKIKILKQSGARQGNFEIPLYKTDAREESVSHVRASAYNIENGSMQESKLNAKAIFKEEQSKHWTVTKFAIPNVKEGSVIEVFYRKESPFIFKFHGWEFQSEIPKLYSEYHALIPGNYLYNITLKGFLKLEKNENQLVKECFAPGGGNKADCSSFHWAMKDIPAFVTEKYMTAKSNFLSSINFELSEVRFFDGRVDKVTKEWKDAETELRKEEKFGVQLKKGKDLFENEVKLILAVEKNEFRRVESIYNMVRSSYVWNEKMGLFSENGIKKAFTNKTGNVADINLALIAALKLADIPVEPVILSTRENGLPIDIHPVLSDFNYVVARVKVKEKYYLLDATDKTVPFGVLPLRCLNGKGRALADEGSFPVDLLTNEKRKIQAVYTLDLKPSGDIEGTLQIKYFGYAALDKRQEIFQFPNLDSYVDDFKKNAARFAVTNVKVENLDSVHLPLKMDVDIRVTADDIGAGILINPFLVNKWESNPFVSINRTYPIDFGVPIEENVVFKLTYPDNIKPTDLPPQVKRALPANGGRLIFEATDINHAINVVYSFQVARPVYHPSEYLYLKEMFGMLVQLQNTDIYLKRAQ